LVKHVRGQVIREVDHRLMWGMEPSTQGNGNDELGAKGQLKSQQPDVPVLGRGLFPLTDQVAGKAATCERTMSWWMEVPSPEQMFATVRTCLARQ